MDEPGGPTANLSWGNVSLAFSFIVFDAIVSVSFGLGVGNGLVTAAVRCIIQLSVVALILQKIFETNNPIGVAGIAFLLNMMGTIETVVNKSKKRFNHMLPTVLIGMLGSTIPVSIIGVRFAMAVEPFWAPAQYIPIVGMLCGATISGIVVSVSYVLKELYDNKDKVEMYLAFGASRFEACKPIAKEALRLALTPNINQMSVLGIIAIPGMMTGAILGGSSVEQAARLQMVIMFMISSSTALASIVVTVLSLSVIVDGDHRVRTDRIDVRQHAIWRARNWVVGRIVEMTKNVGQRAWKKVRPKLTRADSSYQSLDSPLTDRGDRERLLPG
ncbi:hypothetical protein POSPLADRAFT_1155665 [Postia placenta MAD-698-R-SB12]|uniref:Uncharacterized protein n=1 Tax=Postia placenta MAD-698-R-SB12 TaxID=670580 RepID=A0A1X6MN98_9APHY|nr:hypothetical protein POSPLADRAFT_1155665 [Postia placenta MAD-698-R-SB12]OSX57662.1 hypothetical protein POSPLADRAFT_1155665 [Postia placenta MAD-698-R-SB12]